MVSAWEHQTPQLRLHMLRLMLRRTSHTRVMLEGLTAGTMQAAVLPPEISQALRRHRDPDLRKAATKLLGAPKARPINAVLERYRPAVLKGGDARRGRAVYQRACKICHTRGATAVSKAGPDLLTVRERSAEALLEQILDPNREVNPAYAVYLVETNEGREVAGAIANEGPNALTLSLADGSQTVVFRSQIKTLTATGLSLMPEGLHATIEPTQMADLIRYLRGR